LIFARGRVGGGSQTWMAKGGKRERGRERNAIRKDSPGLRANQARGEGGRQTEREKSLAPVLVEKGWTAGERTRW
jgi:hypothetical protein